MRFNFDSDKPVRGETFDAAKAEFFSTAYSWSVGMLSAINVVFGGARISQWWYYSGYHWMAYAFQHWSGGMYNIAVNGQF